MARMIASVVVVPICCWINGGRSETGTLVVPPPPKKSLLARSLEIVKRSRSRLTLPLRYSENHLPSTMSPPMRSEEHTSELQSQSNLVCRLLLEKKKKQVLLLQPPRRQGY